MSTHPEPQRAFKADMSDQTVIENHEMAFVFANEKARIAWRVGREIDRIAATLPQESHHLDAKPIRFDVEYITRGTYAIFLSGTVIGTDQEDVFVVPERTLKILQKLDIPYHVAGS